MGQAYTTIRKRGVTRQPWAGARIAEPFLEVRIRFGRIFPFLFINTDGRKIFFHLYIYVKISLNGKRGALCIIYSTLTHVLAIPCRIFPVARAMSYHLYSVFTKRQFLVGRKHCTLVRQESCCVCATSCSYFPSRF